MNVNRLHHCLVVAELGSFTRAAFFLGVPQSVLSRQVREVEALLGVRLLHRTGRGAVLTEAGRALLPRLQALVAGAEQLREEARRLQTAPTGIVRLGILTSLTGVMLPTLLADAAERLPGVRLHVMDGLTQYLDELLVTGRLDLAILYKDRQVPQPIDEALFDSDQYLIGTAGDPATRAAEIGLASLAGLKLSLPALPNRMRIIVDQICRSHGVVLNVVAGVDAIGTLKDLTAAGKTHTILPLYFVAPDIAAGRLQASRIVDPPITRTVLLAQSTQVPPRRACTEIARLIREVAAALVRSGELSGRSRLRSPPGSRRSARSAASLDAAGN